jgi:hypothetical protein
MTAAAVMVLLLLRVQRAASVQDGGSYWQLL